MIINSQTAFRGQLIMSVAYGYDLKGGDKKIMESPGFRTRKLMSRLLSPGRALVNYLPFCAVLQFRACHISHVSQLYFSAVHSFMGYHTLSYEPLVRNR